MKQADATRWHRALKGAAAGLCTAFVMLIILLNYLLFWFNVSVLDVLFGGGLDVLVRAVQQYPEDSCRFLLVAALASVTIGLAVWRTDAIASRPGHPYSHPYSHRS